MSLDNFYLLPPAAQEVVLDGPSLTPPPGVIPNLENPPNSNTLALAVSASCLCVSTMAFALGAYSKLRLMKNLHIEDFLAFSGYALSIGFAYCSFSIVVGVGYFVHQWNVRVRDLSDILYATHVGSELYATVMMIFKAAILLEWTRIFVPRGTRGPLYWICHSLLWINVLFYMSILIAGNVFCRPYAKLWDKTLPGTCHDGREALDVATGAFNLASDLAILILAQRNIWRLHLRTKKKVGVALIFAIGILACIAAGFRLAASVQLLHSQDATYGICSVALWAHTEIMCAILVFYMPILPTVFRRWVPVVATMTSTNCFSTSETKDSGNPAWRNSSSQPPSTQRHAMPLRQPESTNAESWELTTYSRLPDHLNRPQPAIAVLTTSDQRGETAFLQWAGDRWLFEALASIISTASLAGIIIILVLHAGRPSPRWPFSITINALISTLATISRSALMVPVTAALGQRKWARLSNGQNALSDLETYDAASRGSWDSLILLWSTRVSDLASLGAVVIILSLAFIQQITSFEPAPQPIGQSNVSARIIFETGVNQIGMISPKAFSQLPAAFTPLVTQGLYFDGNLSDPFSRNALQLHPTSSGGNVSFKLVETPAVCSECANLLSYLPAPESPERGTNELGESWQWTLPNQASTHWTLFGGRNTLVIATNSSSDPIVLDNRGRFVILNLTAIVPGWTIDDTQNPPVGTGHPGAAQECSLYWCVNKYDTRMSGGVLTETLTSSFANGRAEPGVPFFSLKPPGSRGSFYKQDSQLYGDYSPGWIDGTFLINTISHQVIQGYFTGLLSGMATSLDYYEQGAAIASNDIPLRLYSMASWDGASPSPKFDMPGIFDAIARGMATVARRADSTANSTAVDAIVLVPGTETAMEVFVRVRWVWIILRIVLQVAAMVFVCTTVASSKS